MLDVVIDQLDRIALHEENIRVEIDDQEKLIKRVNNNAENARAGLEKKNSEMFKLLTDYRKGGKCWKDILLILFLIILIIVNCKIIIGKLAD